MNQHQLAGKRGSLHSTLCFIENVVITETCYKVLEVLSFCGWEMAEAPSVKTSVLFFGEKEEQ